MKNKDEFLQNLYRKIQEHQYSPSVPKCSIDRDKGNGVPRIMPFFALEDYCIYYYCITKIEDKIALNRVENTFGGWTLGGLMRKNENDDMGKIEKDFNRQEDSIDKQDGIYINEFSFNPVAWSKAYGELNARLYATAMEEDFKYVAELDISNYYDSIRLDILEERIREVVNQEHADIVSLLFSFLNFWNKDINSDNKQTVGIPQDIMGDCSRILANFYLQPYDKKVFELCNENECRYLRYVDDQFLFAKKKDEFNILIFKMAKILKTLGLSINQKKVKIFTIKDFIDYRSFKIFHILKDDEDKKDKNKVEKFVDHCFKTLDDSPSTLRDNGMPLLKRALFCPALSSINSSNKKRLKSRYLEKKYLKNADAVQLKKIYELLDENEKQEYIKKLNSLSEKLIHNSFHYNLLNFYTKNKIDSQVEVKRRIDKLKEI